jgi:hypothetical protein
LQAVLRTETTMSLFRNGESYIRNDVVCIPAEVHSLFHGTRQIYYIIIERFTSILIGDHIRVPTLNSLKTLGMIYYNINDLLSLNKT